MKTSRGFTLVELLGAIMVLAILSAVAGPLLYSALSGPTRAAKAVDVDRRLASMLDQLGEDVESAVALPEQSAGEPNDANRLWIRLAGRTTRYSIDGNSVSRSFDGPGGVTTTWQLPGARIDWRIWRGGKGGYAVEARTFIEGRQAYEGRKLLANSRVFFVGAARVEKAR